MSLRRHFCQLPLCSRRSGDSICISKDGHDSAIWYLLHSRTSRRHVGHVPGPLEAKKRANKRRMMNIAQAGGASGELDLSLLSGIGQLGEREWQWQSPSLFPHVKMNYILPLPLWLVKREDTVPVHQAEPQPFDGVLIDPQSQSRSKKETVIALRNNHQFLKDLGDCKDIGSLRDWSEKYDIELYRYSRLAFRQLLEAGIDVGRLLECLDDRALNNAFNLHSFLQREEFQHLNPFDIRVLKQWLETTTSLGQRSQAQIALVAGYLLRTRAINKNEKLKCGLLAALFRGLASSTVLGVKDLKPSTLRIIMQAISQGDFTKTSCDLGFLILKALENIQLRNLRPSIALFIRTSVRAQATAQPRLQSAAKVIDAIPSSFELFRHLPATDSGRLVCDISEDLINHTRCLPESNVSLLTTLSFWWEYIRGREFIKRAYQSFTKRRIERMLAGKPLIIMATYLQQLSDEAVALFILRRELGRFLEPGDRVVALDYFRYLCERRVSKSPYVNMIRAACRYGGVPDRMLQRTFRLLQILQRSKSIVKIIAGLRKYSIEISEDVITNTLRIGMHWYGHHAEAIFAIYRRFPLKSFPELAERMIGNTRRHQIEALRKYNNRSWYRRRLVRPRDPLSTTKARIALLRRMAQAYSTATHLTPRMSFRYVYECYLTHVRDGLGHPGVGILQALFQSGVVWPLQRGAWVSTMRIKWLLRLISKYESPEIAARIDEALYVWRGLNIRKTQALQHRRRRAQGGLREEPAVRSVRNRWSVLKRRVEQIELAAPEAASRLYL